MRRTAILKDSLFIEHDPGFDEVERPERLLTIYEELAAASSVTQFIEPQFSSANRRLISLNHADAHIDRVEATSGKVYSVLSADTFTSQKSFEAACLAAGAVTTGIELLFQGEIDNGFALVRPPGHHAEDNKSMGFCLFNNIAIGARHCLENLGMNRVMVVDWDVHHGNGTQNAFYTTDNVLYISIHQSPLYPGTGSVEQTGMEKGEGYTINIPLPGGQGDQEYANIFNMIVKPIGYQYKPDIILVSAGFDAHYADPLSSMRLTNQGFGYMTRVLLEMASELCDGKILITLEGGYNLSGLKESVFTVLSELCGKNLETGFPSILESQTLESLRCEENRFHPAVERVRDVAKKYWKL